MKKHAWYFGLMFFAGMFSYVMFSVTCENIYELLLVSFGHSVKENSTIFIHMFRMMIPQFIIFIYLGNRFSENVMAHCDVIFTRNPKIGKIVLQNFINNLGMVITGCVISFLGMTVVGFVQGLPFGNVTNILLFLVQYVLYTCLGLQVVTLFSIYFDTTEGMLFGLLLKCCSILAVYLMKKKAVLVPAFLILGNGYNSPMKNVCVLCVLLEILFVITVSIIGLKKADLYGGKRYGHN